METAVGVFTSRERAEDALKELLESNVPEDAIVYLTRSENDAVGMGKEIGSYAGVIAGGAVGLGAGIVAASLALIPGLGQVFAIGAGAATLLAVLGKKAGAAAGGKLSENVDATAGTNVAMDPQSAQDAQLFLKVLREDRSLIVVRTESRRVAETACGVLDRRGLGGSAAIDPLAKKMRATTRPAGDGITVLEVHGRIMLGEGNVILRDAVQDLLARGNKKILLSLSEVDHIDSAGIGELVRSQAAVRNAGGQLKLLNPSAKIEDLLHRSMLHKIFDVQKDETTAVKSFTVVSHSGAAS